MRSAVIPATLLTLLGIGMVRADDLDARIREADRELRYQDALDRQRAAYEEQIKRLQSQQEEELAHQRAVIYLDPYGSDEPGPNGR